VRRGGEGEVFRLLRRYDAMSRRRAVRARRAGFQDLGRDFLSLGQRAGQAERTGARQGDPASANAARLAASSLERRCV
jgi:hypothetical protein